MNCAHSKTNSLLTLIWVGFLGVRFEVVVGGGGGDGGKIILRLKPIRITLETSNVARRYRPIRSFRKYTF